MKILHLLYESENDPFGFGGAAIRTYNIYRHLKDRHRITLVCRKYPGAQDRVIHGLDHFFVGSEAGRFTDALLQYAWQARQFVKRNGEAFDVIIEEFSPATPMFLQSYRKRPVILQIQGFTGASYLSKYPAYLSLPLVLLEKVRPFFYSRILHVSQEAAARFTHRAGSRSAVISNGIDRSLLALAPREENYILYLGRLDIHHKGVDVLLAAFSQLGREHPGLVLKLAGDGRDRRACEALVERLQAETRRRIQFCGWLDGEHKVQALQNALCVVVPSRYETQGIVVLEAAACGKPLIVSDIEALSYIVTVEGALSFRSRDAADLARKMAQLAEDQALRHRLSRNGRKWVEAHTWDQIARQFEAFLLQVVHERSPVDLRK